MTPYSSNKVTGTSKDSLISDIYLMDCIEGMKQYPDNHFDLAIVDPPYGIDLANMNMGIGKSKKASKAKNRKWKAKNWDEEVPNQEYFKELFRVSKNQIIWGGNYFNLGACSNFITWDKEIPEGLSFSDVEFAWTSFSGANKIFRYSAYKNKAEKFHPTQKPPELYKWRIHKYAKQGDKILDTHLGSGSSRIAAYKGGFNFVGFEIDPEYIEKSTIRFNNHINQLTLF